MIRPTTTPTDYRKPDTRKDEHCSQHSIPQMESIVHLMLRDLTLVGVIVTVVVGIAGEDLGVRLSIDEEE